MQSIGAAYFRLRSPLPGALDWYVYTMQIIDPPRKVLLDVPAALLCVLAIALSAYVSSVSVVVVVIATHFLGQRAGRAAAVGTTLGTLWMVLAHLPAGNVWAFAGTNLVTIVAAWLCAELTRVRRAETPYLRSSTQARFAMPQANPSNSQAPDSTCEKVYSKIVDCLPACVCIADPAGRLLYMNRVGVASLGQTLDAITGDKWQTFVHPDDMREAQASLKRCIEAREPLDTQLRIRQYDNVYRWRRIVAEPFFDERGELVRWYVIGVDIDDAVKAQEALKKSEHEARELLDRLPGRFATRTEKDFDFVNHAILKETGATLEKLQNLGFLQFIHPDDRERIRESYLHSWQMKSEHVSTFRWLGADGTYRWNYSRSVPYFNEDGSVFKWYSMTLDIDDLYRSKEIIREREHQLREITEAMPCQLWCLDPDGQPTYINKRTAEYAQISISDLRKLGYRANIHPDDWAALSAAISRSIRTGEPYQHVARVRRGDGVYRWHQLAVEAMRDADGNIVQWYGISVDIDAPKRAEDRLRQIQAELLSATRIATVAELSASIAHELNQPLSSIIANAQACKRWLAASPANLAEARASVDNLVADARSADETMRSIRALFKRQSLAKHGRIVKDLVLEAVRLLRASESKRAAEIEFDFADTLPPVYVDQIQIQQVLINLISNGIEAAENTGRAPRILIAANLGKNDRVVIGVIDNGSGIAASEMIFDPFVTTKAKGMGIGLAVSRSIIEAHDGELTGFNNADLGATFSFSLPVASAVSELSLPA